jgi:hypothetical protein
LSGNNREFITILNFSHIKLIIKKNYLIFPIYLSMVNIAF